MKRFRPGERVVTREPHQSESIISQYAGIVRVPESVHDEDAVFAASIGNHSELRLGPVDAVVRFGVTERGTVGGQTWIAPAKDHGFLVDNCYAYGKAFELPDGTLLIADQGTGGHTTADAKSMSLRVLRVRIRPDHSGIDLLPASSR